MGSVREMALHEHRRQQEAERARREAAAAERAGRDAEENERALEMVRSHPVVTVLMPDVEWVLESRAFQGGNTACVHPRGEPDLRFVVTREHDFLSLAGPSAAQPLVGRATFRTLAELGRIVAGREEATRRAFAEDPS